MCEDELVFEPDLAVAPYGAAPVSNQSRTTCLGKLLSGGGSSKRTRAQAGQNAQTLANKPGAIGSLLAVALMNQGKLITYLILAFLLALGGGGAGAVLGSSHRRLCALISLGAGSLLGVTLFAILPETVRELQWWGLLLAFGSGYAVFYFVTKYVYHVCPACAASHFDEATTHRFSEIAGAMMIALSIHCLADGVALAAGHEAGVSNAPGGRALNLSLVVAICVHKVPEGLALGSLLLGAGYKGAPMLWRVAAVEATTVLGGAIGMLVMGRISEVWVVAIVAHAGGGFLFLAVHAVIGEIFKHHKGLVLTSFAIGLAIIGAVALLVRL